jgi:15-cis-phytoene synthase
MTTATEEGYAACREVVRAAGTSFAAGMRLLPPARRDALFAVYALSRRIDDIADGDLSPDEKLGRLAAMRVELAAIDGSDDPVLVALADAARRFPIPLDAFGDLLEGAELDARGASYETWAETEHYCRCVAGSIGRLSLGVFVTAERERANGLADDLGVALQVGNITRDVFEDLANGRVYLPREDRERFGVKIAGGNVEGPLELLVAYEAQRGLEWLERGLRLVPLLDRRSAITVSALAAPYAHLLRRLTVRPELVRAGHRPRLGRVEKGLVLARGLLRAA